MEIRYESTFRVRGRVQTKEDSRPVSGARLIVTYGSFWQGETVRTDADGRFEADVLPGQVQQQMIGLPETYANWTEEQNIRAQRINVPGDVETFDLPAVEIIPTRQRTGTLLDENNEPVANAEISVRSANRNYGGTSTDVEGNFKLSLPDSVGIGLYKIRRDRHQPAIEATVVTGTPLVLQVPAD